MPALCAFTAPTPVSYLRLKPHTWTGAWSNLGYRDREAGIRICPTFGSGKEAVARQFNFEYRAADATANAYLQLGTIIHAGLAGLKKRLPMPKPTQDQDPETLSEAERVKRKIRRLPGSTKEAFDASNPTRPCRPSCRNGCCRFTSPNMRPSSRSPRSGLRRRFAAAMSRSIDGQA